MNSPPPPSLPPLLPMQANLGKLEARAVSNKGTIEKLRSQVEGLQLKTEQLEKERDLLEASRNDTTAHTSAQIMSLQEVLESMCFVLYYNPLTEPVYISK